MATLSDIARELGVSVATVSNALSRKGRMRDELRNDIVEKAIELGYSIADTLNTTGNQIIVLTEEISSQFCAEMLAGICTFSAEKGLVCPVYSLGLLCRGLGREPKICDLKALVEEVLDTIPPRTAGIIYMSQYPRDLSALFPHIKLPVVYVYCDGGNGQICVNYDDQQGAFLATNHFITTGRRRIAMISGPIDSVSMNNRLYGYQRALVENRIPFDPTLVRIGDWEASSGYRLTEELLALSNKPDAIFLQNDSMAMGAIKALHSHGIRIPEDIAIIGFDNRDFALYSDPQLSSVSPPFGEIGREALTQMINLLEGSPTQNDVLVPCKLVHRGTT